MTKSFHVTWLAVLFNFISTVGFGQWTSTSSIAIPSPNVSALAKFAANPVTLYSGLTNISVPIYSVSSRDINVGISLEYHPSGIKVNEEAGFVGLGWALNAGGIITTIVRGKPDINPSTGLIVTGTGTPPRPALPTSCGTSGTLALAANCTYCSAAEPPDNADYEPDIFYFNFLGKIGSFVISQAQAIILNNDQQLKIVKNASGWILTTPDGFNYEFYSNESVTTFFTGPISWYLTKITSPKNEIVTFEYNTTGTEVQNLYYDADRINVSTNPPSCGAGTIPCNICTQVPASVPAASFPTYNTKYISKINFALGYVLFNANSGTSPETRDDLKQGRYLKNIQVYNLANTLIRQFDLGYSYFNSTITSTNFGASDTYKDINKRLKLDNVTEKNTISLKPHTFTYYYNGTDQTQMLPAKTSFAVDHWGYYNGATTNSRLLPSVTYASTQRRTNPANRAPDATKSLSCLLKTITYPTQGSIQYDYQIHDNGNCTGVTTVGGARILRATLNDNISSANNMVTKYSYLNTSSTTSGKLMSCPNYDRTSTRNFSYPGYSQSWSCIYLEGSCNNTFVPASGFGSFVGYTNVSILEGETAGNGKTVYTYLNNADAAALNTFPGIPQEKNFTNGAVSNMTIYANNGAGGFRKVKETINAFTEKSSTDLFGMVKETIPVPTGCVNTDCSKKKFLNFYKIRSIWTVPTQITERNYKMGDDTKYSEVVTNLEYNNSNHKQITKTKKSESGTATTVTEMLYPADYSTTSFQWISDLKNNYMHALPIEIVGYDEFMVGSTLNQKVKTGMINEYQNIGTGKGLLKQSFVMETSTLLQKLPTPVTFTFSNNAGGYTVGSNYKKKVTYDTYDAANNLLQATPRSAANNTNSTGDIPASTIYSYGSAYNNGILPIASVQNATSTSIAYSSFENLKLNASKYYEGNWEFTTLPVATTDNYTGLKCGNSPLNAKANTPSISKPYKLSFWAKNTGSALATATINYGTSVPIYIDYSTPGWNYYELNFTPTDISVTVTTSAGSNILIDELRLHPEDARMTTTCNDPLVGVISSADENGTANHTEFDKLGRVLYQRDQDKYIRKKYDYTDKQ